MSGAKHCPHGSIRATDHTPCFECDRRERIATAALQGLLASRDVNHVTRDRGYERVDGLMPADLAAANSIWYADALIAALDKPRSEP